MFKENRVEMLWLSPRVNYMTGNGDSLQRVPFQSGYLCSGICKDQIEFEYLDNHFDKCPLPGHGKENRCDKGKD